MTVYKYVKCINRLDESLGTTQEVRISVSLNKIYKLHYDMFDVTLIDDLGKIVSLYSVYFTGELEDKFIKSQNYDCFLLCGRVLMAENYKKHSWE
jgi:hypothetical protein